MNFVAAWKASSIVLTGAFGILGLLKDFKDKDTNEITRWGYISLAGILFSTMGGVAAQLRESSEQQKTAQAIAQQTLTLVQKSDETLRQVQRSVSGLDGMTIRMNFVISCSDHSLTAFCKDVAMEGFKKDSIDERRRMWRHWPLDARSFLYNLELFVDSQAAEAYAGGIVDYDLAVNAEFDPLSANEQDFYVSREIEDNSITLATVVRPTRKSGNGKIVSMADLLGCTVVVDEIISGEKSVPNITPFMIRIDLKDGETILMAQNDKWKRFELAGYIGYYIKLASTPDYAWKHY